MLASIWKRNHLLVALALAVLCATLLAASPVTASSQVNAMPRSLTATAIEAMSSPTPGKTKKPKKTKKAKKAKTPMPTSATPAPVEVEDEATSTPAVGTPTTSTSLFGVIGNSSSSAGKCVTGDPISGYISKADVDWIWEKRMKPHFDYKNWIFDQLMTNNGKLSYCIRWDSTNKLTKATASKFKAVLDKQYAQWNKWLVGYGCWPFEKITIEMVGVAVRNKNLLDWSDDSLGLIYTELDSDGVPKCPDVCNKHLDVETPSDTSACKGKPFDMTFWPTLGLGGGAGTDWGQRVDEASLLATLDSDTSVIVGHEIGHGFGIPDFYEEVDKPRPDMAKMIMEAGASMSVTEADGWLVRRGWEYKRKLFPSTRG